MEKNFLIHNEFAYSYDKLLIDINSKEHGSTFLYIKDNHPYHVFLAVIHSLLYDYPIEVLDGDFSEHELNELGISINEIKVTHKIRELTYFKDLNEVMTRINENQKWGLTLYTSGTTGRPKKVCHSFQTLTRNVKKHEKLENNVWAFAYNPTHMAGLQVFFQAFLNKNTLIYVFAETMKKAVESISKHKVTNISATATFYRNFIPFLKGKEYLTVTKLTFGGEKFDLALEDKLTIVFPNAKIRNIYASTETGTLFTAQGDIFEIKEEIRKLIKISDQNELCIHKSLLGNSDSMLLKGQWFCTGDIVEIIDNTHFRFQSRYSDMINVGGYKVNPVEVEDILIQVPGVVDILVKSKKNSVTGEILVADVIKEENTVEKELKKEIKKFASEQLQEWKVPRIIKVVAEIPTTRTGKKVRK